MLYYLWTGRDMRCVYEDLCAHMSSLYALFTLTYLHVCVCAYAYVYTCVCAYMIGQPI